MSDDRAGRFDPWTAELRLVARHARRERAGAYGQFLLGVLQARAVLESAEAQRRQTLWLVLGTWALVLATIGLVVVAIFFGPEVVVEVPEP